MWSEQFDRATLLFDRMLAEGRSSGHLRAVQMALCFRSQVAYRRGSVAEAEADAEEALALATAGGPGLMIPVTRAAVAIARLERGDLEPARGVLAEAIPDGADPPSGYWGWMPFLHARALVQGVLGHHADALADLQRCGERLAAWGPAGAAFLPWRSEAALAHAALGQRGPAFRLAAEELEIARRFGTPRAIGVALRAAGLVAGGPDGTEMLREAVETLQRSDAQLELARALTDHGAALLRSGDREAARERLRIGLDLAHRCGARALAQRAHQELLATGARPRRVFVSGLDALTSSERRVAAMAADGLSNRAIAQALFVTLRTVETHLSRTYGKLGIGSRTELARAFSSGDR
jgi:ATP/maltotriose-dependent transcriptional regulator MalT